RSSFGARRLPSRPSLRRRAEADGPAVLHELRVHAVHPREPARRTGLRRIPQALPERRRGAQVIEPQRRVAGSEYSVAGLAFDSPEVGAKGVRVFDSDPLVVRSSGSESQTLTPCSCPYFW